MKNRFVEELKRKKISKIEELLGKGYGQEFDELIEKIENKIDYEGLPEGLQVKYDGIKDNPTEEPKLYDIAKKLDNQEASVISIALHLMSESEIDQYSISEISYFVGRVVRKITQFKNDDGVYKKTPNTLNWQPPKPSSLVKYESFVKQLGDCGQELIKARHDKKEDIIKELNLKFETLNTEFDSFLLSVTTLNVEKLSEWEKSLVIQQTKDAFMGSVNSFLGKR